MFEKLNDFIPGVHNFEFTVETSYDSYIGYTQSLSDAFVKAESLASMMIYPHIEIRYINGDLIKAYDL